MEEAISDMSAAVQAAPKQQPNKYARIFGIVVILGVLMNLGAAIPGMIIPGAVLDFIGLEQEVTEFWARLASWLLILLSFMYVPAALQTFRSPAHGWLTVASRWGGVFFVSSTTFILGLNLRYLVFALGDLIFAVPELVLLALAFNDERRRTKGGGR
jgi:hypothetical protein